MDEKCAKMSTVGVYLNNSSNKMMQEKRHMNTEVSKSGKSFVERSMNEWVRIS